MKSNKLLVSFIVVLSIIIIVLIILFGIAVLKGREKLYDKEESNSKVINESVIEFLNPIISDSTQPYYNLLDAYNLTDEEVFKNIIKYLYVNNIYTKEEDKYIFKQSDIKKYAYIYLMKNDFTYISNNTNFTYNSNNKTFISKMDYDMFDEKKVLNKSIDIYEKTESYIYVRYEIEIYDTSKINQKYDITIRNDNNDFMITKIITKQ